MTVLNISIQDSSYSQNQSLTCALQFAAQFAHNLTMNEPTDKSDDTLQLEASESNSNQTVQPADTDNNGSYRIDTLSQLVEQTEQLLTTAKKKVQIYTRDLDPRILNSRTIEAILSKFVRSSRFARVEILIVDEKNLQGVDHRLVSLAQAFSSYISIRLIPKDYHENYFAFYLIDGRKIIYRPLSERFESEYQQVPSSLIKQKTKYFDELWQKASPASALRALHL